MPPIENIMSLEMALGLAREDKIHPSEVMEYADQFRQFLTGPITRH